MGSGQLSYYTDEDKEEYARQSGPPGQGGNYKRAMRRFYMNKGGGKAMIGGVVGESELREVIRGVIFEIKGEKAFADEILRSQESDDEEDEIDEDDLDEFSGAGGVAGFTLPLGMSNRGPDAPPPWAAYAQSLGGHAVQVDNTKSGKGLSVRPLKIRRRKKPKKA